MRLNKEPAGGRIGAVVWRGRRQRFGRVRHQRTIAGRIEQNKNAACGFCRSSLGSGVPASGGGAGWIGILLAEALAFHAALFWPQVCSNADELMSAIVARRLVVHLEQAGFVVMKRPPIIGGAPIARGFEG